MLRYLRRGTGTLNVVPLGHNTGDSFTNIAVRLARTTPVLALLATTANTVTEAEYVAPTLLALSAGHFLVGGLINQESRATDTNAIQNIENRGEELDEIYRAGQFEMAKMTRAGMIRLPTTAARLSVI